jgi:hypothetical protein
MFAVTVFTDRCLVAASNDGRSQTVHLPQVLESHFLQLQLSFDSNRVQSRSYVTADCQSASLSWYEAPIWGPRPDFYYCQTTAGLFVWGTLSAERTGLSFVNAAGSRQQRHPWVWVSDLRVPQPWRSGLLIHILREQRGSYMPPSTEFPFFRLYDSQSYGGGIRNRLHAGPRYIASARTAFKWRLLILCLTTTVFTEPFPSNGILCWLYISGFP